MLLNTIWVSSKAENTLVSNTFLYLSIETSDAEPESPIAALLINASISKSFAIFLSSFKLYLI